MFEKAVKNCKLYKLSEDEILNAEQRMGMKFPKDLRNFYKDYGYGFVNNKKRAINRLIGSGGCADIRLREGVYKFDPDLEMYEEEGEEHSIIFFEINDGLYASIGFDDGKIYYCAEPIADSLEEFLEKTVDPEYWVDPDCRDYDDYDDEEDEDYDEGEEE